MSQTSSPPVFVDLCAGAAAVSLRLVGGEHLLPPVAWMGGKRRFAEAILHVMGLRTGQKISRLVLADAGPWGWVWPALLDAETRGLVCKILQSWKDEDPIELWQNLRALPPASGPGQVAQWLWLQARSAGGIPVWWDPEWEDWRSGESIKKSPVGSRRPACSGDTRTSRGGSIMSSSVVAKRLEAFDASKLTQVETTIWPGRVEDLEPIPGSVVYFDPPYVGRTTYPVMMGRDAVKETALRWSEAGCLVCVSEAEPLDLDGWHHVDVTLCSRRAARGTEWLTMNREPSWRPNKQARLFSVLP